MRTLDNNSADDSVIEVTAIEVVPEVVTIDDDGDHSDCDITMVHSHSESPLEGWRNHVLKEAGDGILVRQYHPGPNFEISQCEGSRYCIQSKPKVPKNNPWQVLHCPSKYISRHHCEIYRRDGTYFIKDLGSVNGTYVNGGRLEERTKYRLKFGDMIYISVEHAQGQGFFNADWDQCYIFLFKKASSTDEPTTAIQGTGSRQPEQPCYDILDSDDSDVEIIAEKYFVDIS